MRRLPLFSLVLLAACASDQPRGGTAPSAPSQARIAGAAETVISLTPVEATERAATVLRERGFVISGVDSPGRSVEARSPGASDPAWATCPSITVRDPFAEAFRSRTAEASDTRTTVTVLAATAPDNATRLVVRARHIGSYINSFTNTPEEAACRSTGVLEGTILAAIAGG